MTSDITAALVLFTLVLSACGRPAPVARATALTAFDHETVFPLSTGEHHKNIDCDACHGEFDTFTQFDCLSCHAAGATSQVHAEGGVSGYFYDSGACYKCHPTGDCHPAEDCAAHPEDCAHADGGMSSDGGMAADAGSTTTSP